MAKMDDLYLNHAEWQKAAMVDGFTHTFTPGADLSQIEADLEKLPKAEANPSNFVVTTPMPPLNTLSYETAQKYIASMYGVPPHLIEQPSPEVMALRKALAALENKITEMQYGQSHTLLVPIWTPPTYMVALDPDVPPAPTIKKLTVTIRLED